MLASCDQRSKTMGGLDIVVNNAAFQMAQMGGFAHIITEQFDRILETDIYALFWISKQASAIMMPGAAIIDTASIQASTPPPELLDYATTKAGIVAFTKGLAGGLASRGIRVIPATMPFN